MGYQKAAVRAPRIHAETTLAPRVISESTEGDNDYTKTITVGVPATISIPIGAKVIEKERR